MIMKVVFAFLAVVVLACVTRASASSRKVEGVLDCGSVGELGDIRVTNCTTSPCDLIPTQTYNIQVDFVASANSNRLNWRVLVTLGAGGLPIADLPITGNIVEGGQYTLRHDLLISTDLAGMQVRVKFEITDVETSRMEVCALAEAFIHPVS